MDDLQCPIWTGLGSDGLDEVQCDLRINHPGDHQHLMVWPDRPQTYEPVYLSDDIKAIYDIYFRLAGVY